MNLAAVMLLLPRMVQILMEGLIPVSEAARDFLSKRASNREIYIGLDSAILIGHPAAISTALLLVPIAILMSLILPGNQVILFADLAVIPFVVAGFAPVMRGNIFRMVIAGIIELGTWLLHCHIHGSNIHCCCRGSKIHHARRRSFDYQYRRWIPMATLRIYPGWQIRELARYRLAGCACPGCDVPLQSQSQEMGRPGWRSRRRNRISVFF